MRGKEESKKCHGGYEKKTEEKSARKRTGRGPGRWLELPLDVADADADEVVVDGETDDGIDVIDVESREAEVVTEGVVGKRDCERDVDSVPTVMVLVPTEVDGSLIDWGMEIDDVAAGSG